MHTPESIDKDKLKFPKISHKSKSVPGNRHNTPQDIVTAKAWLYVTPNSQMGNNNDYLGFKANSKREIASITKVMTAISTFEICQKYHMNIKTTYFKVTRWAAAINGTSADLQENAWMTIEDLLYGLMLPSGNDAALVLS